MVVCGIFVVGMVDAAGLGLSHMFIFPTRCSSLLGPRSAVELTAALCVPQVKSFLLALDQRGPTVLHGVAASGNTGMWTTAAECFEDAGLLEEVHTYLRKYM